MDARAMDARAMDARAMDAAALCDAAMDLGRRAFAGRHYAVAFHELEAALHAAYDLGDAARLVAVGDVAERQRAWLAAHDPGQELSPPSTDKRGTPNLWETLEREVQTRRRMVAQHRTIEQTRPHAGA